MLIVEPQIVHAVLNGPKYNHEYRNNNQRALKIPLFLAYAQNS